MLTSYSMTRQDLKQFRFMIVLLSRLLGPMGKQFGWWVYDPHPLKEVLHENLKDLSLFLLNGVLVTRL